MHDTYIMLNKPFNYPSYLFVKVWGFRPYKPTIAHLDVLHFMISISIYTYIYMPRYPYKGTSGRVTCQRTGDLLSPGHAPQGPTCQSNIYWTLKRAGNKILLNILGMNFIFVTWPPKHLGLTFLRPLSFQNSFALATLKLILHRKCWCGDRWQLSNKLTSVYSREGQWLSTIRGTSGNYNPTPHTISCCPIASLNDTEHWSL